MNDLRKLLTNELLIGSSNFSGFFFKIKDCWIKYDPFSQESISYIENHVMGDLLPPFFSIINERFTEDQRKILEQKSVPGDDHNKTSIIISNSSCNLSCPGCLNSNRDMDSGFPSPEKILSVISRFKNIDTLEITGGEPLVDRDRIIKIIKEIGTRFQRIHIYSNLILIDDDFLEEITGYTQIRIIIGTEVDSDGSGHISVEEAIEKVNSLRTYPDIKYALNALSGEDPRRLLDAYDIFESKSEDKIDTIKLTSPLGKSGFEYYKGFIPFFKGMIDRIGKTDSPHLRGRTITGLNLDMVPQARGNIDCSFKKISMVGDKFINCVYTSGKLPSFRTPDELIIDNMSKNGCLSCEFYPFECSTNIGTENCRSYSDKCLRCPAINVCHKKCSLRGELSDDDCLFLVTLSAFEHWLNVKDMTYMQVMERWTDSKCLPI